jgi:hypothetical protein
MHRLRESVTDAEQQLIVASQAAINSYLRRAGSPSTMRTSIISSGIEHDRSQSPCFEARRSVHWQGW